MKLQLKNSTETFDAPRGIGLALIATGVVEKYVEPEPKIDAEVKWSMIGAVDTQLYLKAECPLCHQGATLATVTSFRHCGGRSDDAPDELAERMRAHLEARRKKPKAREASRSELVNWI